MRSNRVLNRQGARELTPQEVENLSGSSHVHTTTVCTFDFKTGQADGDVGEC